MGVLLHFCGVVSVHFLCLLGLGHLDLGPQHCPSSSSRPLRPAEELLMDYGSQYWSNVDVAKKHVAADRCLAALRAARSEPVAAVPAAEAQSVGTMPPVVPQRSSEPIEVVDLVDDDDE
jgi:hypothetical protein